LVGGLLVLVGIPPFVSLRVLLWPVVVSSGRMLFFPSCCEGHYGMPQGLSRQHRSDLDMWVWRLGEWHVFVDVHRNAE
jgi:hypothetical protein